MDEYIEDLNKFKVVDLKAVLKKNGYKMTGNKPDLIQRILDVGLFLKAYDDDFNFNYTGRIGKSRVRVDYDYDNMTIPMLKTLLKGYMLKLTGRKKDLIERIKAHVSKQDDDDEDFKPKVIRGKDPTLEELEAFELPEYVPTNLLLPKQKEVSNEEADIAIDDIGITINEGMRGINKLMDIGSNIDTPLTKFVASDFISNIGYLNVYDTYKKKSIIISEYGKNLYDNREGMDDIPKKKLLGIYINIPKKTSKEFKSGILFDITDNPVNIDILAQDISYYITKYNENAIVIPFNLEFKPKNILHANLLIYRPRDKIMEWFEPHNKPSDPKLYDYLHIGLMNMINSPPFKSLLGDIRLIETYVLIDKDKYGTITPKKEIRLQGNSSGGTCLVWCLLLTELIFLNPTLSTPEIIRDLFDASKGLKQRENINNIMKGYIVEIEKDVTKYLEPFIKGTKYTNIKYDKNKEKEKFLQNILFNKLIPKYLKK
jgi:hypothetical protein